MLLYHTWYDIVDVVDVMSLVVLFLGGGHVYGVGGRKGDGSGGRRE